MNTAVERALTLLAAVVALIAMIAAMVLTPRVFTGEPAGAFTAASAALPDTPSTQVTDLDPQAPKPDQALLTAQLDAILATKPDKTSFTALVVDVASGEVLYNRNGEQPGTPASSLKVATAIAALDTLGGQRQLATTVTLEGNTLVLHGGGDVLLGAGPSDPAHPKGYAGLQTLAEQVDQVLADRGIGEVELVLDDSLFGAAHTNKDWDKSLFTSNNIAPVYPIALYAGRDTENTRSAYSQDAAARVLDSFAAQLKVKVHRGERGARQGGEEIARVLSAPLREQINYMLLVSDNYLTESMGRLVAVERGMDPAQAGAAVQAVAAAHGASELSLVDASGLAAKNKISPASLTALLRAAAVSPKPELRELVYSLPVGGYNGTLRQRFTDDASQGQVRAKTGSLAGVATLTGMTLTADGRLLAFSIFAAHPDGALAPHKQTIDQAVRAIHACGCRP
ncbi:D-alanyl-D-alanine carboxypeptidase [Glutamicibacter sp. PS]|uniref:D-alanyl-D-alanine carboxypeptidase/D-alanyl-D-alanine-endopeptidase n=1 Tax=Glutamicibacter sp. PS TaxID=3075634 RepID=UPI0028479144|nr:D-alanyl-D-alanine carboxypeptidase [Glutamicibacter sp. PS]MDR4534830.1 D-alanyl-D-alanine carboxypeptidase [Glutamicibacter sp. PS]